eukprot:m.75631 g.75631  ORF g.75631 m.75631 type:complete len:642 (+) comp14487_c0_seq2:329-2254(+)
MAMGCHGVLPRLPAVSRVFRHTLSMGLVGFGGVGISGNTRIAGILPRLARFFAAGTPRSTSTGAAAARHHWAGQWCWRRQYNAKSPGRLCAPMRPRTPTPGSLATAGMATAVGSASAAVGPGKAKGVVALVAIVAGGLVGAYSTMGGPATPPTAEYRTDDRLVSKPNTHSVPTTAASLSSATETPPRLTQPKSLLSRLLASLSDILRLSRLIVTFLPVLCAWPVMALACYIAESPYDLWWRWLIWSIEISGPAFIKFAQWASTRTDVFPETWCQRLAVLHDASRTHSWAHTKKALEAACGKEWGHRLVVEEKPLGSGCVAQVHKGTLRVDGQTHTVAIKVLHPGVKAVVRQDLRLMTTLAAIVELVPALRWLSLSLCVEEFSGLMERQIDMRAEARAMQRFKHNFREFPNIVFPSLVSDALLHEDLLVESYEPGIPIGKYINKKCPEKVRKELGKLAVDAFLKMAFRDNFVHGDMHPGNILVTGVDPEGKASGTTKLTVLDFGIVTELAPQDRVNLIDLFSAVARGKGREAGQLMLNRARRMDCPDPEAFYSDMEKLVDRVHHQNRNLAALQAGELLRSVMRLCCNHRVMLESNFTSVVVSVVVLEGVARSLNPELDLLSIALPVLMHEQMSLSRMLKRSK